jgi:hypothetical protein
MEEQGEILKQILEFLEKNPISLNVNPNFTHDQTIILIQTVSVCRMMEILAIKYDLNDSKIQDMYFNLRCSLQNLNMACGLSPHNVKL